MIAILANIIVALIIITLISFAIITLKKSSKKDKNDCCSFCHNSDCSKCKK